jgi:hypothetical protein
MEGVTHCQHISISLFSTITRNFEMSQEIRSKRSFDCIKRTSKIASIYSARSQHCTTRPAKQQEEYAARDPIPKQPNGNKMKKRKRSSKL